MVGPAGYRPTNEFVVLSARPAGSGEEFAPLEYIYVTADDMGESGVRTVEILRGFYLPEGFEYAARVVFDPGSSDEIESPVIPVVRPVLDLVARRPGTMAVPGAEIEEDAEEATLNNDVEANEDCDGGDNIPTPYDSEGNPASCDPDNAEEDHLISVSDNDITVLIIRNPGLPSGEMRLEIEPEEAARAFVSQDEVLLDRSVDLANPAGQLAGLAIGDVTLYLEMMRPEWEVAVSVVFELPDGQTQRDTVKLVSTIEAKLDRNLQRAAKKFELAGIGFAGNPMLGNTQYYGCAYLAEPFLQGGEVQWQLILDNALWEANFSESRVYLVSKPGVSRVAALKDVFESHLLFRYFVDCRAAVFLVQYYAEYLTLVEFLGAAAAAEAFDSMHSSIRLECGGSTHPALRQVDRRVRDHFGDWRILMNPWLVRDEVESNYNHENYIQLSNLTEGFVFAHAFGVLTMPELIVGLNNGLFDADLPGYQCNGFGMAGFGCEWTIKDTNPEFTGFVSEMDAREVMRPVLPGGDR